MKYTTYYRLRNLPNRIRGKFSKVSYRSKNMLSFLGLSAELEATLIKADGSRHDLGVISERVVTDAGAQYLVDCFQNLAEPENMNYHASGTGTTAEAVGDTALVTEVASRQAGTQSEGTAVQYKTVATISYSGTFAITEHGIFSAAAAGTLWDRSVFTAINVVSGDSIQFTYTLTVNSGG